MRGTRSAGGSPRPRSYAPSRDAIAFVTVSIASIAALASAPPWRDSLRAR
jgi:hypothetical protein